MESHIVKLFKNMEILYENIFNLLKAFQLASSKQQGNITVSLKNLDGSIEEVNVNSFQHLQNEINRISNNFSALTNENNISHILNADGTLSQYVKTSFINAEYITNVQLSQDCIIDKKTLISDFLHPLVKIPITIDQNIKSNIITRSFQIQDGFELIPDNVSYLELKHLIETGDVILTDQEIIRELTPEREQVKYFGQFDVISSVSTSNSNEYSVKLNTILYGGLNVNKNNIELKVGDELVSNDGVSRFIINDLSVFTNTVIIQLIAGQNQPQIGSKTLLFNQIIETTDTIIGLPVKPMQDLVVFLSTENINAIGYPSVGIKISTQNYNVVYEGSTYTIDEFFSNYVTNISDYLLSIIDENTISNSLGIKPTTPNLLSSNFKVVQINKHVTNSKNIAEINKLNTNKKDIYNKISEKEQQINNLSNELNKNIFKTVQEKNKKQKTIDQLNKDIDVLNNEMLVISRRIDNDANESALKTTKAKYKIVGYWPIQNDLYSPLTGIQHVIKYEVQYRYLNPNSDNIDVTSLKMVDNGKEVSVVFSAWNNLETISLQKIKDINGKFIWEDTSPNTDDLNINQCMISINENESVEVRIRAISEAGYPINPVKSEWSNILRINFPEELKINNIDNVVNQNLIDLRNSEFNQILQAKGLLSHITDQLIESEKTYHHRASFITSGLYTNEMKNIPLDVAITTLKTRIDNLEQQASNLPTISVFDLDDNEYVISNNQTLSLFFGNIKEQFDIYDETQFGKIFKNKFRLRIANKNQIPIEIRSLNPQSVLDDLYMNVPVVSDKYRQQPQQIIYFRKNDLSLLNIPEASLYSDDNIEISTFTGYQTDPKCYQFDGSVISLSDIPTGLESLFIATAPNINISSFKELVKYHSIIKSSNQQLLTFDDEPNLKLKHAIYFQDVMKYSVGYNTCGAFLYPILNNNIIAKGNSTTSSVVISPNSEIEIPLVFEYRVNDALGNYDGVNQNLRTLLSGKYTKKLGISMLIGNLPFLFDIETFINL